MTGGQTAYCTDSSSLISCHRFYPIDVFERLWRELDALVDAGRLIAPEEVWLEINRGTDRLTEWAATWRQQLSIPADAGQIAVVSTIAQDFPQSTYSTITEHRADPWVVALAQTQRCCVMSEERGTSRPVPKIPQMCDRYGMPHRNLLEVMHAEGWRF